MDRGAWWAILHRVAKSQTKLNTWHILSEQNWKKETTFDQ